MTSLVLAASFFVGIHLFVSGTTLRDRLVATLGEGPYMGLFSLASLAGIVWMCAAYSSAPGIHVWGELPGARLLALVGTLVGFLLVIAGLTTPSPTLTGGEGLLRTGEAPGIQRITRHPFLWGVAIWALTHFLANGDAASLVFFGALALLSLAGPPSIDAKRARSHGESWDAYAARTSNIPFAAIAAGRNQLALGEIGWWKLAVGLVVWGVLLAMHVKLFGASPFPM